MGGLLAAIPGIIGVIGSLFGKKNKGTPTGYSQMGTQQQQQAYSSLLSYLMQNMKTQPAGQYGANMGMYTLMNQFYPGAGYQMPTTPNANKPGMGVGGTAQQMPQGGPLAALFGGMATPQAGNTQWMRQ